MGWRVMLRLHGSIQPDAGMAGSCNDADNRYAARSIVPPRPRPNVAPPRPSARARDRADGQMNINDGVPNPGWPREMCEVFAKSPVTEMATLTKREPRSLSR